MSDSVSESLRLKIEKLPDVTTRPMFGYQCYSVKGKFFVGFHRKHKTRIIIRLPKDLQKEALADVSLGTKPFSHGARMGWIEIEIKSGKIEGAFELVRKGYEYALTLSEL